LLRRSFPKADIDQSRSISVEPMTALRTQSTFDFQNLLTQHLLALASGSLPQCSARHRSGHLDLT
jgi:hypothetical protein